MATGACQGAGPAPAAACAHGRGGAGGSTRPVREELRSKEGLACDGPGVTAASTSPPARPPAPPGLLRCAGERRQHAASLGRNS